MTASLWISKLGFESLHPSQGMEIRSAPVGSPAGALVEGAKMQPATLVTWALALAWLTVDQASALMGPRFPAEFILALIDLGAVDAEETDSGWIVEKSIPARIQRAGGVR